MLDATFWFFPDFLPNFYFSITIKNVKFILIYEEEFSKISKFLCEFLFAKSLFFHDILVNEALFLMLWHL